MSDELKSLDPYVQGIAIEARRPVSVDPAARRRLLEAVRSEPVPRRRARAIVWLLEPRHLVLPPLAAAAIAAGLVGIGILGGIAFNRDGRFSTERPLAGAAGSRLPDSFAARAVKFELMAPQAARVSLVGDFNGWDMAATPAVREKDGTWSMYVPLRPGRYVYSFVVDGTHFISDPTAPIAPDDGYGQKNSVVVVGGATL